MVCIFSHYMHKTCDRNIIPPLTVRPDIQHTAQAFFKVYIRQTLNSLALLDPKQNLVSDEAQASSLQCPTVRFSARPVKLPYLVMCSKLDCFLVSTSGLQTRLAMAVVDRQSPRKQVVDYFEASRHLGSGENVVPPSVQQIVFSRGSFCIASGCSVLRSFLSTANRPCLRSCLGYAAGLKCVVSQWLCSLVREALDVVDVGSVLLEEFLELPERFVDFDYMEAKS